ncbi:hypothetical protein AB0L57_31470 [Nocardia sp. NPDC052254]|uniref:hypothetical protein n=1 Tax=Nocardia sp. NPDC052254 TaxID=3155681 RepID=UPI00342829D2
MKIIASRWRSFEYTPLAAGPCAVPLPPTAVGVPKQFLDCLLLRIVVEPGDCPLGGDIVEGLLELCARARTSAVVIGATPRCADRSVGSTDSPDVLAHIADTLDVLADLTERLTDLGDRVHLLPFGWNLACRTDVEVRRPRPHCPRPTVSARSARHRGFRPHR